MATDEEIMQLWKSFPDKKKETEAIIRFYRLAEKAGMQDGISAVEKELLSDATLEAALQLFGWGRGKKESIITTRAVLREAMRIAAEKVTKR